VSPRNKDRSESRPGFAAKSAANLQRGIGLVIIDFVIGRRSNLHNELIRILNLDSTFAMSENARLYTVAYRPLRRDGHDQIDAWPTVLNLGESLPVMPLALRGFNTTPLDIDATYEDACRRSRL
jgi:hypothetical protein